MWVLYHHYISCTTDAMYKSVLILLEYIFPRFFCKKNMRIKPVIFLSLKENEEYCFSPCQN